MTGGIGRVTTVLTDYFRKHFGWKVYSIFAFDASTECKLTETDGAIRLRLHDRMGIRRSLKANYPKAAKFIGDNHVDIVIIQTSMDVVARLRQALDESGLQHVKVISVLHYTPGTDEFPIDAQKFWKELCHGKASLKDLAKSLVAPLYNRWEHQATVQAYRKAYQKGDGVVVLSQSYIPLYKQFAGLSETSHLTAIPNSVPFDDTVAEEDIEQKHQTCLLVGRMVDFPKRVSLVLRMWKHIEAQPEAKDWNLQIVGDGPDLASFRQQAQTLGLQRCSFPGRQNPIDYYRQASLFFMTSSFEGFPMTLVEAQQMGCVPVAFDSFASLHEVVNHEKNGMIVAEGNTEGYQQAVLQLMKDSSKLKQMAQCATQSSKAFNQDSVCSIWKEYLVNVR